MNQHTLALELNGAKDVFVYSPTSTNRLLQTVHTVAGGRTEQEIKNVLHPAILHHGKAEYGEGVSTVDALVVNKRFMSGVNHFQSVVTFQDFNKPDEVANMVNGVVRKTTKEKIKTVVMREDISPRTAMIGFNALYAKMLWEEEMRIDNGYVFEGDLTQPMMSATSSKYKVLTTPTVTVVMAPDKKGLRSMLFIKQNDPNANIKALYETMDDPDQLNNLLPMMKGKYCKLVIPKFKAESDIEMTNHMRKAIPSFGRGMDLSGIINGCTEPLEVDKFIQKAVFECSEKGCEGAAVTMMGVSTFSYSMPPDEFVFYTPFVYLMIDNATKHVLFSGLFAKKGAMLSDKPLQVKPTTLLFGKPVDVKPTTSLFGNQPGFTTQQKPNTFTFVGPPPSTQPTFKVDVKPKDRTVKVSAPTLVDNPNYETRLATFCDWPSFGKPRAEDLARAGFIYTRNGDQTKCVRCQNQIVNWEPYDVPTVEHARHHTQCPNVREMFSQEELDLMKRTSTLVGEKDLNRLATLFKRV